MPVRWTHITHVSERSLLRNYRHEFLLPRFLQIHSSVRTTIYIFRAAVFYMHRCPVHAMAHPTYRIFLACCLPLPFGDTIWRVRGCWCGASKQLKASTVHIGQIGQIIRSDPHFNFISGLILLLHYCTPDIFDLHDLDHVCRVRSGCHAGSCAYVRSLQGEICMVRLLHNISQRTANL